MQKTNIDWQKRRVTLRIEKKDGQTSERTDWSRQEIELAEGQPLGHIRVTPLMIQVPWRSGDRLTQWVPRPSAQWSCPHKESKYS